MANFYTNAVLKDKRFNSKKRVDDVMLLEPFTRGLIDAIIIDARAHGVEFMVFEAFARQQLLFHKAPQNSKGARTQFWTCL
jgi:hypothetical protein